MIKNIIYYTILSVLATIFAIWLYFVISFWYYPIVQVNVNIVNDTKDDLYYELLIGSKSAINMIKVGDTILINSAQRTKVKSKYDIKCVPHSPLKRVTDIEGKTIQKKSDNENNWNIFYKKTNRVDCYFYIERPYD